MSVAPALTDQELVALAGPSAPRWYAVYDTVDGNVVATARVNAPSGLTYPLTNLPVDGTSGGWGDVAYHDTIFIGTTPATFDKGIYRVRQALGSPDFLAIMAIGENDSGAVNIAIRNVGIEDNDYVTVLKRFGPFGVYPRIDYPGSGLDADIFEDWDNQQFDQNRYAPPIVNLVIDGQPANYATHVYGGTSKTFDIDFEIILWPTSSSVDWAIQLPGSWTLNSGSLTGSGTSGTINVTAPHSAETYTLQLAATEDHDAIFIAYRKVWIKSNTYPPLPIVRIDNRVDDRTGSRRTITFNSLPVVPPDAMWHLFDMGTWNGEDMPTASKCFTGWVQRRKEDTGIGVANVTLDLIGPSYMLDLIGGQSQIMSAIDGDPANWQQLYYLLSYLDFILWWILYHRVAGFLQMFNLTLFGLTNTQKRMTDWRIDTGTILSQLKAQTARFGGGNIGCDPTGEFMFRRQVSRIPWADRGDVPVRATLTVSMFKGVNLGFEARPQLRRLRGECFVSDGLTTNTPIWSDAPPVPGQGSSEEKFERLICDSADELYELNGNEYQARNNPYPNGSVPIPKNWAVFYPAQMARIGLDIAPRLRFDGQEYTGYVLPTQITYTDNPDGTVDVAMGFEVETVGLPGVDVPIPSPDASQYNSHYQATPFSPVPFRRSLNPNPAGTKKGAAVYPKDGSLAFCATTTQAFVVTNFTGTPQYRDVTPSGLGGFTIRHGGLKIGGTRAWLLVSDGTNTKEYTTPNVFALPRPTWTAGTPYTGIYTLTRAAQSAGHILTYGASTDPSEPLPAPAYCVVAADFNRYAVLVGGSIVTGGHTSVYALSTDGAPVVSGGIQATVRYTFSTPVDVISSSAYFDAGGDWAIGSEFFDNGGGSLRVVSYGAGGGGSGSRDMLNGSTLTGVKHIDYIIRKNLVDTYVNLLSDIEICYT